MEEVSDWEENKREGERVWMWRIQWMMRKSRKDLLYESTEPEKPHKIKSISKNEEKYSK